jgi:ankyrin repeat protein
MKLIEAIIRNNVKGVRELLEEGTNPNSCEDRARVTPLHFAAQNNSLEIAKLLITAGADIAAENEEGDTPLDTAVSANNREMIDLLRQIPNQWY